MCSSLSYLHNREMTSGPVRYGSFFFVLIFSHHHHLRLFPEKAIHVGICTHLEIQDEKLSNMKDDWIIFSVFWLLMISNVCTREYYPVNQIFTN